MANVETVEMVEIDGFQVELGEMIVEDLQAQAQLKIEEWAQRVLRLGFQNAGALPRVFGDMSLRSPGFDCAWSAVRALSMLDFGHARLLMMTASKEASCWEALRLDMAALIEEIENVEPDIEIEIDVSNFDEPQLTMPEILDLKLEPGIFK